MEEDELDELDELEDHKYSDKLLSQYLKIMIFDIIYIIYII